MQNVYLFGMNSLAQIIAKYIENDERYNLLGFTANKKYCEAEQFLGTALIPFEDLESNADSFGIINCVGYSDKMGAREFVGKQLEEKKIRAITYIHPSAIIDGANIGSGSIVMQNCVIEPFSEVGKDNVFYGASYICHDAAIGDYNWFSAGCVLAGYVQVGNNNFFGINASVRDSMKIGNKATVGAGAVVVKNVADSVTVVGNPARILESAKND